MTHTSSIALMMLAASSMVTVPLRAQWRAEPSRPVSVVVSAGTALPTGAFGDYHKLGIHGDVSLIVRFAGQGIRLRPEVSYQRFSLKNRVAEVVPLAVAPSLDERTPVPLLARTIPGDGSGGSGVSSALGLIGNIELPLVGGFYLIGGVGASRLSTGATESANDVSDTALTYNGGAGVRVRLRSLTGFVEGRLQNLSIGEGKARFNDMRTIPITIGIAF